MRAIRIAAQGFRNLAPLHLELPPRGALILGPNGHGKTSLLEALAYPVLQRSVRGAADTEVTRFGAEGFHLRLHFEADGRERSIEAGFAMTGRRKRVAVDGAEQRRLSDAIGHWSAVCFLPADLALVQGAAAERRRYLDQVLSLAEPGYLGHLSRYREALAQRNAALRQGRSDLVRPFDRPLSEHGAAVIAARLRWVERMAPQFATECASLGEHATPALTYRGRPELANPAAWEAALAERAGRDLQLRATSLGPHRDDLLVQLDGRSAREYGSTGQQRGAAVALRLCELVTLAGARGSEPALLLDDVFAELDAARQRRLASRLWDGTTRQVFVTAPRHDELPSGLELEVLTMEAGQVRGAA